MKYFNFEQALDLCGGNQEVAKEIIQMMSDDLPIQEALLKEAFQQKRWEEVDQIAHKLSGSAAYCGMDELKLISRELSHSARELQLEKTATYYDQVQELIKKVKQAILDSHVLD